MSLPAGPECVVLGARPVKRFTQNSAFLLPNFKRACLRVLAPLGAAEGARDRRRVRLEARLDPRRARDRLLERLERSRACAARRRAPHGLAGVAPARARKAVVARRGGEGAVAHRRGDARAAHRVPATRGVRVARGTLLANGAHTLARLGEGPRPVVEHARRAQLAA